MPTPGLPVHMAVALDGAGWHPAAWREPGARPAELFAARYLAGLVGEAERGLLDFVTFEDSLSLQSADPAGPDERTDQVPGRLDAVLTAARVAPLTRNIGLIPAQGDVQTYREHIWRRDEYEALFDPAPAGVLRGESTPFYLYDRAAQRRIRALIPDARLIVILRDPVERAHSNWTHLWSAGLDPVGDVVRACAEEDRRIAAGWADFWRYTALGRYGEQLEHLYTVFSREQVMVFRYRALVEDPAGVLDRICAFLRVPAGVLTEVPRENVTAHPRLTLRHRALSQALRTGTTASLALPRRTQAAVTGVLERRLQQDAPPRRPLTWEDRQALIPRFEADIGLLEHITGESFGDWLAPRGDSGGLVGARPSGQRQARNGQPRAF